ncbi:BspA family leucine-rich repeat surface protein [Flavobacterium zhairuonense]|uniref:BspA family leucine-rich repeat surface protein n=1 Tax=Flavobacterium zhairuonense TaxID=2493631 RepID=UPI0010444E96|nr:BspA family leucine-rich repeat surface protein [Flavobacterium zhairuonense]KAF2507137.1 BspA family leucine-rich repeat surface protein [Flavobacterium zhairuonense]
MGSLLQNTVFGRTKNSFVSTWRTSNTSSGSTTATQIKLPLISAGSYNFIVDWGDGTSSIITTWNQTQTTHNYSVAGVYTIKIKGRCKGWVFNNAGDKLKILSIQSWGNLSLGTTQKGYFWGCSNLNLTGVTDLLNLSETQNLSQCFYACNALTFINRANEWDTSGVTNMNYMFLQSNSFNQDLGNWNVSNVLDFTNMFNAAPSGAFNNGGSSSINNWNINTSGGVLMTNMFNNQTSFNQSLGNWNMTGVTAIDGMFNGCSSFNQDLSNWERVDSTLANVTTMAATFQGCSVYNKSMNSWNVSGVSSFSAFLRNASLWNNGLGAGVSGIMTWNLSTSIIVNLNQMFQNCQNFNQIVGGWNTNKVANMTDLFSGCTRFNNGMTSAAVGPMTWDLSNCASTARMFQAASAFNQDITSWNMTTVNNTNGMFTTAKVFNQAISNWERVGSTMGNVTNMTGMFQTALAFNNGLPPGVAGNMFLDFSNATTLSSMFIQASAFNQNLGAANMSKVTNFTNMFSEATKFNNGESTDINNWILNTSVGANVIMDRIFASASKFNQPLNNWNVSEVTNMTSAFSGASIFNKPLNNWNTQKVTSMAAMFATASFFNQDISNFNLSNVTTISQMFYQAGSFNNGGSNGINNWDTSKVTNMGQTFQSASAFTRPINNWNISNVTSAFNFMAGKNAANYSTANLDAIYNTTNGWASRPVKANVSISFSTIKYTAAGSAGKAILTGSPNNWTITDGGI